MNYNKLYSNIIQKSINKNRKKNKQVYYENHHILPECLGGLEIKENMVLLTAKEHFICHHLLTKIYPTCNDLIFAFWAMCNQFGPDQQRYYKITATVYQKAKIAFAKANSILHKGKSMPLSHSLRCSKQWTDNNPHKNKFGVDNINSHQYIITYNDYGIEIITGLQNFAKINHYNRRSLYKLFHREIKYHKNIISIQKII